MTRAKDISKIVTDADLSGTLDVTGTVTAGGLTVDGDVSINGTNAGQLTLDATGQYTQMLFEQNSVANSGGDLIYNHTGNQFALRSLAAGSLSLKTGTSVGSGLDRLSVANNGDISFYEDTGTTPKLFWDASEENLGIGTSSPSAKLDISAGTNLNIGIEQLTWDNFLNDGIGITFSRTSSDDDTMALGVADGDKLTFGSREGLIFATGGVSTYNATSEKMRIDSSGNVGIGTGSPTEKLDLVGGGLRIQRGSDTDTIVRLDGADGSTEYLGLGIASGNGVITGGGVGSTNTGLVFKTAASGTEAERMRIDNSGNVLVGTTTNSTNSNLILSGATRWGVGTQSGGNIFYIVRDSDNVGQYMVNGSTSWTATSDERVKDIIEPITNAVEKVSSLRSVIGKYKADEENTRRVFLIAQDVQAVLPEAVNAQDDDIGTLGLQYTDIIPLLTAAIQELSAKNDA
jgi:hypothetical protein